MERLCIVFGFMFLLISCSVNQKNGDTDNLKDQTDILIKNRTASDISKDTIKAELLQGEIDSPISLSDIEKYDERMSLGRLTRLPVTHEDAYRIRTQQSVYSIETKNIQLEVINYDGPTAEPGYYRLEQWSRGRWVEFPFQDNLSFAGIGRELSKGNTLLETISTSEFKNPLTPNKYKIHFYVYANIYTYCMLTDNAILPIEDSSLKGAFDFGVLKSVNDSIRILFANHTNLRVQPTFFPSVGTDSLYSAHPFARSGWIGEHKWMEKHASLSSGDGLLFGIPVSWEVNRLRNSPENRIYASGRLSPGKYKIGLGIEVYMTTEFEIK